MIFCSKFGGGGVESFDVTRTTVGVTCRKWYLFLLILNSFDGVVPIDIRYLNMSRNRGIFVVSVSWDGLYVSSL